MIYDFSSSFEQFWLLKSFISDYIYFEEDIFGKNTHQGCVYLIKNALKTKNLKYYYNLIFLFTNLIYCKQ